MKQYLDSLRHIKENGRAHSDRTGVTTKRVFGYQTRYNLSEGFPLLTTKELAFRWIAEELLWFLSGDTNNKTLQDKGITIWDAWATKEQCEHFGREENDLGPVYGQAWRNFGATAGDLKSRKVGSRIINKGFERDGVDQIKRLCHLLKNNPDSRRMIVSGWNPAQCDNVALPPCHTLFQFSAEELTLDERKNIWHGNQKKYGEYVGNYTAEKLDEVGIPSRRLSCGLWQRSCDSALGEPYNLASYSLLTMMLAHVHNMVPGDFIHTFGDKHIYANHFDGIDEQLSRKPRPLPILDIDESLRGGGFDALMSMKYEHLKLKGYNPHPKINFEVAV